MSSPADRREFLQAAGVTGAAAVSITFGFYLVVAWWLFGKSVGKAVMGLRIVRPDGTTPGLWRCLLRYIGYGISALFCFNDTFGQAPGARPGDEPAAPD